MKRLILFLAATAAVAALACYVTLHFTQHRVTPDEVTSHEWLHQELKLTDEQLKALEPIEHTFGARQRQLADSLRDATRQLARVMAEEKAYTPRVSAAVEHVHHCMGDLQKTSIEHVFAMRAVLSPAQGDRLLELAQQALEQSP
ncbi:MAG TPA: periplasmic heavy metal sensor [Opitutaceae bacterium]|jgi:Spy/CpxP family protein refolding chaperone|nr:periplasmic heavy metal sensor [Opitutaceae bacterium]